MRWHSGLQLRILDGPGAGQVYHLTEQKLVLGRARGDTLEAPGWVFLPDRSVSRHHATLLWEEAQQRYSLFHQSETNYTWVNGEIIQSKDLSPGDRIRIGPVTLGLEKADPAQAPPAPAPQTQPKTEPGVPVATAVRGKTLRLEVGAGHVLQTQTGPLQGQEFPLAGLIIALGRGNVQPENEPNDPNPLVFDLMVEVPEPALVPNHFILKWRETEGAFEVWKRPGTEPVQCIREQDGFEWHGWIAEGAVTIRRGDRLLVGATGFLLTRVDPDRTATIKL